MALIAPPKVGHPPPRAGATLLPGVSLAWPQICANTRAHTCPRTYVCARKHTYVSRRAGACPCTCKRVRACPGMRKSKTVRERTYVCACTCVRHAHVYANTCATHRCARCTCKRKYTCKCAYVCARPVVCKCKQTCKRPSTYVCVSTRVGNPRPVPHFLRCRGPAV